MKQNGNISVVKEMLVCVVPQQTINSALISKPAFNLWVQTVEQISPVGADVSCCPFWMIWDCCASEPPSFTPNGRLLFIRFTGVLGGRLSIGPNRRLYESLPGLLRRAVVISVVPFVPNTDDCRWFAWALRGDCCIASDVPKMSLLPPPGGFRTLQQQYKCTFSHRYFLLAQNWGTLQQPSLHLN